jgi:ubiquinone/menaquinone biosynthesis C-methylase UbiE
MEEAYTGFAEMYDLFMDTVPYEEWGAYVVSELQKAQITEGLVLDLGCGTGSLTEYLAAKGYDMIGVDNSYDMLNIAQHKKESSGQDILYLCQDMRELELYGTVAAVISICDSINYMVEPEDLVQVLKLVNNYLDPNGLFLFDFNTDYKYREMIGDTVIAENREEGSFIWENIYDEESRINEYDLTIFKPTKQQGLFEKIEEIHYQRGYTLEEMKQLITAAGMVFEKAVDADTHGAVHAESQRIYIFARECGKIGKE